VTRQERAKRERLLRRRYTRNIIHAYRRASPAQQLEGSRWYEIQGAIARVSGGPGVVAAISPGLRWGRNLWWARELTTAWRAGRAERLRIPTYSYRNVVKAIRILAGEDPDLVLSGPKVRAFWRLLRDGGNEQDVCVDGHSVLIAKGEQGTIRGEGSHAARVSVRQYALVAEAYRSAGRALRVQACRVQATTWLARRARGQEQIPF